MNLGQIYRMLTSILPSLSLKYREYNDKQQSYDFLFSEVGRFTQAYRVIERFAPFLISDIMADTLKSILIPDGGFDIITTDKNEGQSIIGARNMLVGALERYTDYLLPILLDDSEENSFDVKFIHITDLDELEKTVHQLQRALNRPVFELEGQIILRKVDTGSIYITLGVVAAVTTISYQILKMIANLIWAAAAINNKINQDRIFYQQGEMLGLKNEMLKTILEHSKSTLNDTIESEAQHVLNDSLPNKNNPENLAAFKDSIEMFGSLLEKGAEFYPSLKAQKEIKDLFPDVDKLGLIESKLKLLNSGGDKKD